MQASDLNHFLLLIFSLISLQAKTTDSSSQNKAMQQSARAQKPQRGCGKYAVCFCKLYHCNHRYKRGVFKKRNEIIVTPGRAIFNACGSITLLTASRACHSEVKAPLPSVLWEQHLFLPCKVPPHKRHNSFKAYECSHQRLNEMPMLGRP